jgi:hypothetical protein
MIAYPCWDNCKPFGDLGNTEKFAASLVQVSVVRTLLQDRFADVLRCGRHSLSGAAADEIAITVIDAELVRVQANEGELNAFRHTQPSIVTGSMRNYVLRPDVPVC